MSGVVEMDRSKRVLVTGGGGFIGGHLVAELQRRGFEEIRAVDLKPLGRWYQEHEGVENVSADLREKDSVLRSRRRGDIRLQSRRRHGRDGLHRDAQGGLHGLGR